MAPVPGGRHLRRTEVRDTGWSDRRDPRLTLGGTPDQDWSLRITLVFRRDDGWWLLVHRHADPLVHPIDMVQTATLARGSDG